MRFFILKYVAVLVVVMVAIPLMLALMAGWMFVVSWVMHQIVPECPAFILTITTGGISVLALVFIGVTFAVNYDLGRWRHE